MLNKYLFNLFYVFRTLNHILKRKTFSMKSKSPCCTFYVLFRKNNLSFLREKCDAERLMGSSLRSCLRQSLRNKQPNMQEYVSMCESREVRDRKNNSVVSWRRAWRQGSVTNSSSCYPAVCDEYQAVNLNPEGGSQRNNKQVAEINRNPCWMCLMTSCKL